MHGHNAVRHTVHFDGKSIQIEAPGNVVHLTEKLV